MKTKILIAAIFAALAGLLFVPGCATPPPAFTDYIFDYSTNYTAKTVPVATNIVEREVVTTNAATGDIIIQPIRETVIETVTKQIPTIEVVPSPEMKSWGALISTVAESVSPGSGSVVGLGLLGLVSMFGINQKKRLTNAEREAQGLQERVGTLGTVADSFAQSIEVLREVLKTTPQGRALDLKIVDMLQRKQIQVGIVLEAARIVSESVYNEDAKRIAQKILETLPAPAGVAAS
jgi:hypothetical protein